MSVFIAGGASDSHLVFAHCVFLGIASVSALYITGSFSLTFNNCLG